MGVRRLEKIDCLSSFLEGFTAHCRNEMIWYFPVVLLCLLDKLGEFCRFERLGCMLGSCRFSII